MLIQTDEELKQAVKKREPELVITSLAVIKKVMRLMVFRRAANVIFFVVLGLAILMLANPLKVTFFETNSGRLVRQILLLVGIILLFADYLIPVARLYKISGRDEKQLKLTLKRPQS